MEPVLPKAKQKSSSRVLKQRSNSGCSSKEKSSKPSSRRVPMDDLPVQPPPLKSPTSTLSSDGASSVSITVTRVEDDVGSGGSISPKTSLKKSPSNGNDLLSTTSSTSSNSREKLVYTPHKDGFMNENKRSFDTVDFCFLCDKVDPFIVNEPIASSSSTPFGQLRSSGSVVEVSSSSKRPRSTSDILYSSRNTATISSSTGDMLPSFRRIRQGQLRQCVERTGFKGLYGQAPVYRTVFLCPDCVTHVKMTKSLDDDFCIKITKNALTYF